MFKKGIYTSEFWIAAVSQALALLVILGIVTMQDKATLEGALSSAVTAVGTLITSAMVVWKYIQSRTTLKTPAPPAPDSPLMPMILRLIEKQDREMMEMRQAMTHPPIC
jgi:hypothetical protein